MITREAGVKILFVSPAGSTRRVAGMLADGFLKLGRAVELVDLGSRSHRENVDRMTENLKPGDCLVFGSPVFAQQILPPVWEAMDRLPLGEGMFAAPIVTYGGVNSGAALHQMSERLTEKGYAVLGGAKVLAVHSLMWKSEHPLGEGRPDRTDAEMLYELAAAIHEKMAQTEFPAPLPLERLLYLPAPLIEAARKRTWADFMAHQMPTEFIEADCQQCGGCEAVCPVQNIRLDPYPIIGDHCVACMSCVRVCASGAMRNPGVIGREQSLRDRAAAAGEPYETRIFY